METILSLTQIFLAVCMIENPADIRGVHPDGVSYGVAGITQPCLDVANRILKTDWSLADMDNPTKAKKVFKAYTSHICFIHGWSDNPSNRLRAWHPGDEDYVERGMALAATFKR